MKIAFEYPEDRKFFAELLAGGDEQRLDREFADNFDFRDAGVKRREFDKTSRKGLEELLRRHEPMCQLRLHPDCSKEPVWQTDHLIPLSSNELNKKLRHMTRTDDKKVPAQSFGSNHPSNLLLACKRCNAYKKHRILLPVN